MTNYADEIDPYEYTDDYTDRETMISGWTDEEIDAYDAYMAECDRYDDMADDWPGDIEISEPPF